jgi:hypothetical protein
MGEDERDPSIVSLLDAFDVLKCMASFYPALVDSGYLEASQPSARGETAPKVWFGYSQAVFLQKDISADAE